MLPFLFKDQQVIRMCYFRESKFIHKLAKSINSIRDNWRDLRWWKNVLYIYYFRYIIPNTGVHVMEEDWDNLIILDACRYDMFRETNDLPGVLEYKISRGSCTKEFLLENFGKTKYYDTVYITGNPLVDYWVSGCFYKVIPVWKDGWDEEYGTVLPRTMVEYSLKIQAEYPDKRLIIHFVQPHFPFIGEKARNEIGNHRGIGTRSMAMGVNEEIYDEKPGVWELLKKRKIKAEILWDAYKDNLQTTLPYVKELVDRLRGKTVVSSDHANLFAERIPPLFCRFHGHPCYIHTKNLTKVPWLVIESNDRKIMNQRSASEKSWLFDAEATRIKKKIRSLTAGGD